MFNQYQNQSLFNDLNLSRRRGICIGSLIFIGKLLSNKQYNLKNQSVQTCLNLNDINYIQDTNNLLINENINLKQEIRRVKEDRYRCKLEIENTNNIRFNDIKHDFKYLDIENEHMDKDWMIKFIKSNIQQIYYYDSLNSLIYENPIDKFIHDTFNIKICSAYTLNWFFSYENSLTDVKLKTIVQLIRAVEIYKKYNRIKD